MAVRNSTKDLITLVRTMIGDTATTAVQFDDQTIQDRLDQYRTDVRYEPLKIAPTIINLATTNNQPQTIFADYYSTYGYIESDYVLQGTNVSTAAAWIVIAPTSAELMTNEAHFMFETAPFVSGTVPGQYPPVFLTCKSHDPFAAAADLLEFWAATKTLSYNIAANGQSLHRSQMFDQLLKLAAQYRMRARARAVKMRRDDVVYQGGSRQMRLLDAGDDVKGY